MALPKASWEIDAPASVLGSGKPKDTSNMPNEVGGGKLKVSPPLDKQALDSKTQDSSAEIIVHNDPSTGKAFTPDINKTIPKPQVFK